MRKLYEQLRRAAPSDTSILISGESGTGKELVARSIHRLSSRADKPFVAINCTALSETLLESELFGHLPARLPMPASSQRGLFLEAEGGTLLLDEIGDMPLAMQVKLLPHSWRRTAFAQWVATKRSNLTCACWPPRIATWNRMSRTVGFRQDLFYRINVIRLYLPPLRSRGSDILRLATRFIEIFAGDPRRRSPGSRSRLPKSCSLTLGPETSENCVM